MRHLLLAGLTVVLSAGLLAETHPNFSGTWTLDHKRSRFDDIKGPKRITIVIDHQEPKIHLNMQSDEADAAFKSDLTLMTDGTPVQQTIDGEACAVTATWGSQGQRLVVDMKCQRNGETVEKMRMFKMGAKGKMMTTVLGITDKKGQKLAYGFYTRQS